MLNTSSAKTCRIVDGKLTCVVKGNKDLFNDKHPGVAKLQAKIDKLREDVDKQRRNAILATFRTEVDNFVELVGSKPSLCLMNYRDMRLICEAWNNETELLRANAREDGVEFENRPWLSTFSSDDKTRKVDGIRVKQGCDTEPGQIRFYSAELQSDIIIGS